MKPCPAIAAAVRYASPCIFPPAALADEGLATSESCALTSEAVYWKNEQRGLRVFWEAAPAAQRGCHCCAPGRWEGPGRKPPGMSPSQHAVAHLPQHRVNVTVDQGNWQRT